MISKKQHVGYHGLVDDVPAFGSSVQGAEFTEEPGISENTWSLDDA
jgi:hypothetical protein